MMNLVPLRPSRPATARPDRTGLILPERGLWLPSSPGIIRPFDDRLYDEVTHRRRAMSKFEGKGGSHKLESSKLDGPDGGSTPLSFTLVNTFSAFQDNSASTYNCTISGIAAGDVAFAALFITAAGAGVLPGTPTGFTSISANDSGASAYRLARKVLVGSETSVAMDPNGSGLTDSSIIVAVYRPNIAVTTFTNSTFDLEVTTGDPASQLIDADTQTPPVVLGFALASSSTGSASFSSGTFTTTVTESGGLSGSVLGIRLFNTAPASDITVDAGNLSGSTLLASGWVKVAA